MRTDFEHCESLYYEVFVCYFDVETLEARKEPAGGKPLLPVLNERSR